MVLVRYPRLIFGSLQVRASFPCAVEKKSELT